MEYPKDIITAIHAVMEEVSYVQKDGENSFHKYKYASEGALIAALRPAMQKHGLILIPSAANHEGVDMHGNTHLVVEYTLAHKSGAVWPEKIRAFGAGNDRSGKGTVGDKGTYKAITGANKYMLRTLFQIATGDDPDQAHTDQDGTESPTLTTEQVKAINDLMVESGADVSGFLSWLAPQVKMKLTTVEDIPATAYNFTITALERKRDAAAKKENAA